MFNHILHTKPAVIEKPFQYQINHLHNIYIYKNANRVHIYIYIYVYKFQVYYDTRICNTAMSKDNKMVNSLLINDYNVTTDNYI